MHLFYLLVSENGKKIINLFNIIMISLILLSHLMHIQKLKKGENSYSCLIKLIISFNFFLNNKFKLPSQDFSF
jgi:hypothetical protein